jgi:hypothetical protein
MISGPDDEASEDPLKILTAPVVELERNEDRTRSPED